MGYPQMIASLRTEEERQLVVAAVTHSVCPGGLPVLMEMLSSDIRSVQSQGVHASWLLVDRLGGAFAENAVKAGLVTALAKLLPPPTCYTVP